MYIQSNYPFSRLLRHAGGRGLLKSFYERYADLYVNSVVGRLRLGYCFTPYQRLWLYNGAPVVAFYDTHGDKEHTFLKV